MALTFFTEVGMGVCSGFLLETVLILRCVHYCWALPIWQHTTFLTFTLLILLPSRWEWVSSCVGLCCWPGLNHDRCTYRKAQCRGRSRQRDLSKVATLLSHSLRLHNYFLQHFKKQVAIMDNSVVWVSVMPVSSFNLSIISGYECIDTCCQWCIETKIWQMKESYVGEILCV